MVFSSGRFHDAPNNSETSPISSAPTNHDTRKTMHNRSSAASTSLGGLATHLGNIPSWVKNTFEQGELDIAPPGAPPFRLEEAKSRSELLAAFDKNVADARAALKSASDEKWRELWSLLHGGNKIFTMPRAAVMRSFVMNHLIHHRAQLGVYLRLIAVPVASIYGPAGDGGGLWLSHRP